MGKRRYGKNPLSYLGVSASSPPDQIIKDFAPETIDAAFDLGTEWVDTDTQAVYKLTNKDSGVATWTSLTSSGGDLVVTADSGTATSVASAMDILGDGVLSTSGATDTLTIALDNGTNGQILVGGGTDAAWANLTSTGATITITEGANTINIESIGGGGGTTDFATDSGTATQAAGTITMAGGVQLSTSGAGSTVTFDLDNGTNGQLLIGGGTNATWANITSSGGSVTITEGSNTINLEASGVGGLSQLDGDSGSATPTAGAITIAGGSNLTTLAAASTLTVALDNTISVSGSITAATGLTATLGGITTTGTNTLNDLGNGAVLASAAGVLSSVAGNDGQILLGATGSAPAWGSVTSSGGTITISEGANTLNLEATTSALVWNEVTSASQSMAVNSGYISNSSGTVVMTLPSTSAVGSVVRVAGYGSGGWVLAQNAGQSVIFNDDTTTTGITGFLQSSSSPDAMELLCVNADTEFSVISSMGNISLEDIPSFTQRTSGFTADDVNAVAHDGTYWVIAGAAGKLATATNPTGLWTLSTSGFTADAINDVHYGSDGYWVAVGANDKLSYQTNPTGTWTNITPAGNAINGIGHDGTYWVFVGDVGELYTATSPAGSWTSRTSSFGSTDVNKCHYGNSIWVATGDSSKLATAVDPTGIWANQTIAGLSGNNIHGVYYANGYWVAVTDDNAISSKIITATDPTSTWTINSSHPFTGDIWSVTHNGFAWIAVGEGGEMAWAFEPTGTWTSLTSSFSGTNIFDIAYGSDGYLVAAGASAKIATGE